METTDPATGQPLPADAIQRVLFVARSVHVYNIPPMATTKGYTAASWTEDPKRHIFTVRLRVIETAITQPNGEEKVKTDVILEDSSSGQLFAAAPYTVPAVVESALDSSRFFALRVQDPSGRKATLGIGFEERSEAFDFSIALQEAQKALGIGASGAGLEPKKEKVEEKRDYSLKEGETITVNLGGKFRRRTLEKPAAGETSLSSFSLPPPPPSASATRNGGGASFLSPPPSASDFKSQDKKSAKDLGFDDGQFGEFA